MGKIVFNPELHISYTARWIILLVLVAAFLGFVEGNNRAVDARTTNTLTHYWACMDGCSNMLEVQYGGLNESLHPLQTECDNKCEKQYWSVE